MMLRRMLSGRNCSNRCAAAKSGFCSVPLLNLGPEPTFRIVSLLHIIPIVPGAPLTLSSVTAEFCGRVIAIL
ncbi:hypothetical protein D3C76_1771400 [compost metagenome]